jgi:competence protein ComEC
MTLFYMALAWAAGIALAFSSRAVPPAGLWIAAAGAALTALVRRDFTLRQIGLCIIALGLGIWRVALNTPDFNDKRSLAYYNDRGSAEMVGLIVAEPDVRDQDIRLRVEMQSIRRGNQEPIPIYGLALVSAPRYSRLTYGDKIRIQGQPTTPPVFDTFSYRDYLARSGLYTYVPFSRIARLERDQGSPILSALFDIKKRSHELITRLLPSPQSALLTGILLGNQDDIAPEITDAFNATGTSHIIAISGSNITIVAGLLLAIFGRLTDKRLAAILMLVGIGLYTIFVGASPSVVRAAVMGSLAIIAQRFGRRSDGLTALAASTWFMTALNPGTLFDLGLILSVAATLGLILYTEPLTRFTERMISRLFAAETARRVVAIISDAVLITLAAQITTLPLIFLLFGRFSAISFLVNVLVIPAQPPIMSLGILALAVGTLWLPAGQLVAWLVGIPLSYTLAIIRAAAQLPGASVPITLEPAVVVGYYVLLFVMTAILSQPEDRRAQLFERVRQNVTAPSTALLGLAVAGLLWAMNLSRPDSRLHVWFLAVGQGNAVLIQTPRGAHFLIDGGENPTRLKTAIGDRLPFYKNDLDILFVTEPVRNTIAALPPLFERYAVRQVVSNGQESTDTVYTALQTAVGKIGHVRLTTGYRLETDDGVNIEAVSPLTATGKDDKANDAPLVLRLTYGDASFLLTSDLSEQATYSLLSSRQYLGATVLQLPSNGGEKQNPPALLNAVSPQVVVIEAEQGNPGAQPSQKVLSDLRQRDIAVYRTDLQGTIEITTDGHQLFISTVQR